MDPIASKGDLLLDGKVRIDRVFKTRDMASHTYVLSFPGLPSSSDGPITGTVQIGYSQSAATRKRDLATSVRRALFDAQRAAKLPPK